jgi:hypothetical protein
MRNIVFIILPAVAFHATRLLMMHFIDAGLAAILLYNTAIALCCIGMTLVLKIFFGGVLSLRPSRLKIAQLITIVFLYPLINTLSVNQLDWGNLLIIMFFPISAVMFSTYDVSLFALLFCIIALSRIRWISTVK